MKTKTGLRTNQIVREGKGMRSKSVTLRPGSVRGIILISGFLPSLDPIDTPYVEAGAVSKIWLTTGEIMWVTSSPDELKTVTSWPP